MQTFERRAPETVVVHVGDDTIRCTPEHPFWVEGCGWTEAQDLHDGNLLRDAKGLLQHASCVEFARSEITVYNFEVKSGHTYFVGDNPPILVHNANACGGYRSGDLPARGKPNSSSVKDYGNGNGQIREYGPDGRATKDFDFGHDHGSGDPHAHDWDWSNPVQPRGPGRPLGPNE
jgi:hypothetical protein